MQCPICLEKFSNPVQTDFLHIFCSACIEFLCETNCPICRRPIVYPINKKVTWIDPKFLKSSEEITFEDINEKITFEDSQELRTKMLEDAKKLLEYKEGKPAYAEKYYEEYNETKKRLLEELQDNEIRYQKVLDEQARMEKEVDINNEYLDFLHDTYSSLAKQSREIIDREIPRYISIFDNIFNPIYGISDLYTSRKFTFEKKSCFYIPEINDILIKYFN